MTAVAPPYADPNLDKKRSLVRQQYGLTAANLGWQKNNITAQQGLANTALTQKYSQMREALPGTYAGRGLLNSGIYGEALYNENAARTNAFASLANQYGTQQHNNSAALAQAGQTQSAGLADVDLQEAQARAALAAQLKTVV